MPNSIPESDWKKFRILHDQALARFCQRVLDDLNAISNNMSKSPHERYREIYGLIHERDRVLADTFDGASRSNAFWQLLSMNGQGLIEPAELAQFTPETQARVKHVADSFSR